MSGLLLADTGPLLATLSPADQYHQQARRDAAQLNAEGLAVGVLVPTILEAYTLIARHAGRHIALGWLADLAASTYLISPVDEDYALAFAVTQRFPDQDLTLFDTTLYAVSERLRVPIWTYDHHFDILRARRWYPA